MNKVRIKEREYSFVEGFKDNDLLRKSFNELTRKTYGFDFEQWYQDGYWGDWYIPYSLLDGEDIVANVSISIIKFLVMGEHKTFIQIGTVMTDDLYKNQGLSRYLMEKVINEWKDKCNMIYLFANDSVIDFYPKFGFVPAYEYQCSIAVKNNNADITAEKLDMSQDTNRYLLLDKINKSNPHSKLSMLNNAGLIMFYCTSFMSDNVYYLRDDDAIVIAEHKDSTLYLQDIFSHTEVNIDTIINKLTDTKIEKVVLGFTPNYIDGYCIDLLDAKDSTLFILQDKVDIFKNNKLMFPVLSHA